MSRGLRSFVVYDIKNGLLKQWKVYIVTVIACIISICQTNPVLRADATGIDYIFNIFSGILRVYISPDMLFNIPFLWFVFMIIPSFLIGSYAVDDLNAYGIQMIVRSRSKLSWWISKTIWCVFSILLYFATIIVTMSVYSAAKNISFFGDTLNWCEFAGVYRYVSERELILHGIAMPAMTILTLCMLQMLLSLFFGSIAAYMIIIVYNILSAYITNPIFIGNFSMLLRDNAYVYDGLSIKVGVIIEVLMLISAFIVGIIVMKNRGTMIWKS